MKTRFESNNAIKNSNQIKLNWNWIVRLLQCGYRPTAASGSGRSPSCTNLRPSSSTRHRDPNRVRSSWNHLRDLHRDQDLLNCTTRWILPARKRWSCNSVPMSVEVILIDFIIYLLLFIYHYHFFYFFFIFFYHLIWFWFSETKF